METIHKAVLLKESIEFLNIKPEGTYVDGTLGDGGYSMEILKHLSSGRLVSFDYDEASINFVKEMYAQLLKEKNWMIVRENFANIAKALKENGIEGIDGAVFDLGLSSRQIEDADRGFSYQNPSETEVNMRMDERLAVKASDLLTVLSESELERMFFEYGEERNSRRIAKAIKTWLQENPSKAITTKDLVEIIRRVVPANLRRGAKHPAMKVFQALRIAVNAELENLKSAISSALSLVNAGGRIVIVSYHSLEDRIVKDMFNEAVAKGNFEIITEKPVMASEVEITENSRAKSAKLRAIERK